MANYNVKSERALIKLYPTLEPVKELDGVYSSELPGPAFMAPFQRLFLKLSGLPGWGGKQFSGNLAVNMIRRRGCLVPGPRMNLRVGAHDRDGKVGLIATYDDKSPFLWRHCTDEFRYLTEDTVLGISRFDLPGLRHKDVMFLLHRAPYQSGVI